MTSANTNTIAKIAAVLAGLGLVASSFAAFAPAARAQSADDLQDQIDALLAQIASLQGNNSGASAAVTFSQDLTLGSSGADVTALQNWLISKGYAIAAGATGYFGAQTQAALAKYQAAEGISPASGYFGPITRAKVNATGGSTGGTDTDSDSDNDGDLSGGEADLSDFDLVREESEGNEGEEEVAVFTAEFDVEDGDVLVERMEITASSTRSASSNNPWDYFDRVVVTANGEEVADMDVDDRDAWDEEDGQGDDQFTLNLTGLDIQVDEGDRAEITVAFDIAGTIDSDDQLQDFVFSVKEDAIRATDAEGIQQYIGSDSESVTFGFGAEENGELRVRSNSDDPDSSILVADEDEESEDYTVFIFNLENREDVDSLITELAVGVTPGSGNASDYIRRATLVVDGDEYDGDVNTSNITFEDLDIEIAGDEEVTVELMVTLVRDAANTTLAFDIDGAADIEAEGVDSGDDATVEGEASSATHTVATTGIAVESVSTSQSVTTPGSTAANTYATYTIKFDVTALEDDAFIDDVAATSTTNGIEFDTFGGAFTGTSSAVLTSTADLVGSSTTRFLVEEGETETFTLTVTLDAAAAGTFGVMLEEVNFNDINWDGDTVFTVDSSNDDYRTDAVYIAN